MRRVLGVVSFVAVLAATLVVVGASPAAAQGERYKDEIFTSVDITSDLLYGQATNYAGATVDLKLDIYEPQGDVLAERPLYIWVHGGSFAYGDKADAMDALVATKLAKRGFVVASINYRLRPIPVSSGNFLNNPESLAAIGNAYVDAQNAVVYLRNNANTYRIDTDRVAMGGASAGAVTSLNVGFWPLRWKGQSTESDPRHVDAVVSVAGMTLGGFVEPGEPPTFMAHGTQDVTVPYADGVATCNAIIAKAIPCQFESYPTDHYQLVNYLDDILEKGTDFLYTKWLFPVPKVTSTLPNTGSGAGGTTVTINGKGFQGATSVKFGTAPATSFAVLSDTQITAVSPPRAMGLVNVSVTTQGGLAPYSTATWFNYNTPGPPAITSLAPNKGPAVGGNTVTINGRGFTGATAVKIGLLNATSFTVVNDAKITAVVPARAPGIVNAYVTTPLGTSPAVVYGTWYQYQ